MAITLLPGERVRLVLRPHPLGFAGRFFAALLPALLGALLWWLARTDWWAGGSDGKWYQLWAWLYGNPVALSVYTLVGMGLAGAAVGYVSGARFAGWFGAGGVVAVAAGIVIGGHAWSIPAVLVAWAVFAVAAVDVFRRSHRYHLTNIRLHMEATLPRRRAHQVRYEAITDLDEQPGLFAFLDVGSLIPVSNVPDSDTPTVGKLAGVRPLTGTKLLVQELIAEVAGTRHLHEHDVAA